MSQERVILVGVETEKNYLHFDSSMKELKSLTKTANGEVVFSLVQKTAASRSTNRDRQGESCGIAAVGRST